MLCSVINIFLVRARTSGQPDAGEEPIHPSAAVEELKGDA